MKNKRKLLLVVIVIIILLLGFGVLKHRHKLFGNIQTSSPISDMQSKNSNLVIGKIENIPISKYENRLDEQTNSEEQENSTTDSKVEQVNKQETQNAEQNQQKEETTNKQTVTATKIVYGKSAQGRNLEAYLIKGLGNNSKTIFLDFEVHRL